MNFREDCTEGDVDSFRRRLNRIGDRVQVTGDMTATKVHVHTNNPGNAIEYGIELGELVNIKIDNMLDMKRKLEGEKAPAAIPAAPAAPAEPEKEYGMVAVSLGEGFSNIFRDLTVDHIVEGGQTMNPSVDDILSAINAVNAKCVFVFPNNGNVIFAANQAAELAEKEDLAKVRPDLDGNEIMEILDLKPGPDVGRAWAHLKELRLEHGPLERDAAIAHLRAWWESEKSAD